MGLPRDKDERRPAIDAKKSFFLSYEEPNKNKNKVKREPLKPMG